jgi:hypothetical protein
MIQAATIIDPLGCYGASVAQVRAMQRATQLTQHLIHSAAPRMHLKRVLPAPGSR